MIIHRETEAQSPTATPKESSQAPKTSLPETEHPQHPSKLDCVVFTLMDREGEQGKGRCWRSRWLWAFPRDPWELLHFLGLVAAIPASPEGEGSSSAKSSVANPAWPRTSSSSPGVRRGNTCSHSRAPDMMSMLSRRKNLRKRLVRGSLTPLSAGGGVCSSLGGSDAAGSSTGWQLAQSTHCFGWSRLQKPNTQRDPPTSTWAELPQAGQENSPWKEGAAVISPSWALQLC